MGPEAPLPISSSFTSTEEYVDELLAFATTSRLFKDLCGGVHILDFFTREPDIFATVLPQEWRNFFAAHAIMDILDLFMREDLDHLGSVSWRSGPCPPSSLIEYVRSIRRLSLDRSFLQTSPPRELSREVAMGMMVKKKHEVSRFAEYTNDLVRTIDKDLDSSTLTHIVDLGSGQGYLTRALASPPYHHRVVGIESRENNIKESQNWDVLAKIAAKPLVMRNKKEWRMEQAQARANGAGMPKADPSVRGQRGFFHHPGESDLSPTAAAELNVSSLGKGSVQYIPHYLSSGDLNPAIDQLVSPAALSDAIAAFPPDKYGVPRPLPKDQLNALPRAEPPDVRALVIALHSCGNLVHHGLRSLLLTPSVKAVALVGCCYNLLTERLTPPSSPDRGDEHGFPMSTKFLSYVPPSSPPDHIAGIRLNMTARMMAVQAPLNWGSSDSASFFRRHFLRAVLQRIFLDLDLIPPSTGQSAVGGRGTAPVILGSLPKNAYRDLSSYVRAAAKKFRHTTTHPSFSEERARRFAEKLDALTEEEIGVYEERYTPRKKDLAVVWSLMAFSAMLVESLIVVDRWVWLGESGVERRWVEAVWDYGVSPRNLVVVGVKSGGGDCGEDGGGDSVGSV